jgi:hypothetical protein
LKFWKVAYFAMHLSNFEVGSFKTKTWTSQFQYDSQFLTCICAKYCACHEKVEPRHTKCCTCHEKWYPQKMSSATQKSQPFHNL